MEKKLSFCIPIMNRFFDISSTLSKNLQDNLQDRSDIEFIVVCFDADSVVKDWIQKNFSEHLKSEYLRFFQFSSLKAWHFGKAKNSFKKLIRGKIYASLDGDNFTGLQGGRHIINIFERHAYNCIFHQFQGEWGDGTCGRVSVARDDYIKIGYDDNFLPRQWDEMDLMLSVLTQQPARRYVCYEGKSIIKKSQPFSRFIMENDLRVQTSFVSMSECPIEVDVGDSPTAAVGTHDNNYVQNDPYLRFFSKYNHLLSYLKNVSSAENKKLYLNEIVETQREMTNTLDCKKLKKLFFEDIVNLEDKRLDKKIILVACLKNERLLFDWLRHYRELGVDVFFLIDDKSTVPLASLDLGEDVLVFSPKVGSFRYAKAFWMEILIKAVDSNNWCVVVDGDEFLDFSGLIESVKPLKELTKFGDDKGLLYFCAFLLDMVPASRPLFKSVEEIRSLGFCSYDSFQFRPPKDVPAYSKNPTSKWSYGESAEFFYRLDVRFRLNRSFDCMRKFPIFNSKLNFNLNQGFHDLLIDGIKRKPEDLLRKDLLVIKHYKFYNLVQDAFERPVDAYHHDTQKNISRLRDNLLGALNQAVANPFVFKYVLSTLVPKPGIKEFLFDVVDFSEFDSFKNDLTVVFNDLPRYHISKNRFDSFEGAVRNVSSPVVAQYFLSCFAPYFYFNFESEVNGHAKLL